MTPVNDLGLLCLLALESPAEPDPDAASARLATAAPHSGVTVERRVGPDGERGLYVTIDRQGFAVVGSDGQIPEPAVAEVLQRSVFWRGRAEALARHRAMVAISAAEPATGHGLLRAQAAALTRLAAAIAADLPTLACCWPSAATAVPPQRLAAAAAEIQAGRWPVDLWIGFALTHFGDAAGQRLTGARSRGAAGYFGAELDVFPFATDNAAEPMKIIVNITNHLMTNGAHLRPGQTATGPDGRVLGFERVPPQGSDPALIRLRSMAPGEPGAA